MLPSVNELCDARARVEAKLLREKKTEASQKSPRNSTSSQNRHTSQRKGSIMVDAVADNELLGSSRRSRSTRDSQGSSSEASTPLHSEPVTTKSMFGTSGVCGPYHHSALITSTLNDPSWFRLAKGGAATATTSAPAPSSPLVHQQLHTNSAHEHFFGGIRPGVFPSLLSPTPRQQQPNIELRRGVDAQFSYRGHSGDVAHVHLPVLMTSATQNSPRRW
ncbi:Hypothetical protein, putative [Bodo saltans]|uniref:Uncharacterized protein n=1 Tax=Bodo saltans TaxID=75058 RepID=A0A0S4JKG5_BODSA|nr:Hypothetical protein, putative [Bodo saltans]|eukprot:CUG88969.1 Hypothetical protein, putative [Bodo saltans]